MLTKSAKEELERQAYRIVGDHSAVKICGWTKNMIKNGAGCYKLKFYGIMSNQCLQMTTSMSCANRCRFCWRGYKATVSKEWKWGVDDPKFILEESKRKHHKLLEGFNGNPDVSKQLYAKSRTIKHVALSLTGEPITYPKINELIKEFHREGISTFLVTNAQYPEHIRDLEPITQLYISLDAPNKEMLKDIDLPLFDDYWERLNHSLEFMSKKKQRTCIRLTMVKGVNDRNADEYASLIMKGNPDFIEVKGYMHIGASRQRLTIAHMPWHEDIVEFSKELKEYLPDYEIVSEHVPSRVVMLAKKKFKIKNEWFTWIDFEKFDELIKSGRDFSTGDYIKPTPETGLSERITKKEAEEKHAKLVGGRKKKDNSEKEAAALDIDEMDLQ